MTEKQKKYIREYMREYRKDPENKNKCKAAFLKYQKSEKGKQTMRKLNRTEKRKLYMRKYMREYYRLKIATK